MSKPSSLHSVNDGPLRPSRFEKCGGNTSWSQQYFFSHPQQLLSSQQGIAIATDSSRYRPLGDPVCVCVCVDCQAHHAIRNIISGNFLRKGHTPMCPGEMRKRSISQLQQFPMFVFARSQTHHVSVHFATWMPAGGVRLGCDAMQRHAALHSMRCKSSARLGRRDRVIRFDSRKLRWKLRKGLDTDGGMYA